MNPAPASPDDAGRPSGRAALVAVLCAFALVILASMVGSGPLPIDLSIRDALHVGGPVPLPLDILNTVGDPLAWGAGVAVVVAALWLARRRLESIWIGSGVLAAEALATAIKVVVDRPRPPGIVVTDWITQASFPSGHVTRVAATGALIVLFWPSGRRSRALIAVVAVAAAVLMGLARIVAGAHWPTDVLGAYLLVGVFATAAAALPQRFRRTRPGRPQPSVPGSDDGARPP